ncbi:hypothetical protein EQG49_13320 [Periweissella cryptocerci]|uniref:Uncharacterized protein n=1 Tax=Periweissella cryptocerci TaxID=2506420 RepID=A0A4P6YX45_9LACO|nr:hypothetical protein [Periweissella cryptocerci]QBO37377.1 hypothetical protein EQG49_13320 [Periweissella cryptocerci]
MNRHFKAGDVSKQREWQKIVERIEGITINKKFLQLLSRVNYQIGDDKVLLSNVINVFLQIARWSVLLYGVPGAISSLLILNLSANVNVQSVTATIVSMLNMGAVFVLMIYAALILIEVNLNGHFSGKWLITVVNIIVVRVSSGLITNSVSSVNSLALQGLPYFVAYVVLLIFARRIGKRQG